MRDDGDSAKAGRARAWLGRGLRHPFILAGAGVLVVVAVLGATFALSSQRAASSQTPSGCVAGHRCKSSSPRRLASAPAPLSVTATTPGAGATNVASDTTVTVDFSSALGTQHASPTLSPAVAGTWTTSGRSMAFSPSVPFVPFVRYTLTVPSGVTAVDGAVLPATDAVTFTVGAGSVLRLQQLLAELGYLPLSFTAADPPVAPWDMAVTQPGSFAWRWGGLPASLTTQWSPGVDNEITKAAVMSFEAQHGLTVGGQAGPAVWTALLADVAAGRADSQPVSYVLVTKTLPEHLTVWVNGVLTFSHVPCNTGVPGATTPNGTFAVFEHVRVSNMKGTDVTGTTYDVTVPWASYFTGGDALHGYPRANYGFPQSNGCVEMPIPTAGKVWPDTPLGTLVTVA